MSDNLEGSDSPELDESTDLHEEEHLEEEEVEELQAIDLDGEEVTLDQIRDWKSGHMKDADYRQKTADLANQRKTVQGLTDTLNQKIGALDDTITSLEATITAEFDNVNWKELREEDRDAYFDLKEKQSELEKAISKARAERQEAKKSRIPAEQQALMDAMPEWAGKEGQKNYEKDIKLFQSHVNALGFTAQEIAELTDHRVMKAMINSARYENLKTSKPTQKVKKTKVTKPGTKGAPATEKTLGQLLYG